MKVHVRQGFAPDVEFELTVLTRKSVKEQAQLVLRSWEMITGLAFSLIDYELVDDGEMAQLVIESPVANRPKVRFIWRIEE